MGYQTTGSKVRTNNTLMIINFTIQDKQNEWSIQWFSSTASKVRTNNVHQSFVLFKTNKLNGHFMGFRQLVQKLEQITPIICTLQDKQNEWSFYGFSSTGSKVRMNKTK